MLQSASPPHLQGFPPTDLDYNLMEIQRTDIPWQERLPEARYMDTHSAYLQGGPDTIDLAYMESLFGPHAQADLAWPARALIALREWLGTAVGWDKEKESASPPLDSYFWSMTEEEIASCLKAPGRTEGPARILWNDEKSLVAEVLNATCQAFAVAWLEEREARISVFVIETKWWSKYYLALIEPFRKWIVYPALVKWIEDGWRKAHLTG